MIKLLGVSRSDTPKVMRVKGSALGALRRARQLLRFAFVKANCFCFPKVLIKLFQKFALSRARSPCRAPQSAKRSSAFLFCRTCIAKQGNVQLFFFAPTVSKKKVGEHKRKASRGNEKRNSSRRCLAAAKSDSLCEPSENKKSSMSKSSVNWKKCKWKNQ